jgi:mannose-6-phosphate isomerase
MSNLPLLRFRPILREYIWGGRRLAELGKPIGNGDHYAESWEVVDHGQDQSVVMDGPLAGRTLHELVAEYGKDLFGRHFPQRQFPLLFKYLDCQRTLSVQVHPNDQRAATLTPPDLGKTEAWVVLAAEPGSRIYAGLKPDVDRTTLEHAVAEGHSESCLYEFEPRVGDCLLIEAGTVHALGAGLLVAEIQQASNTTFRLHDWNRLDADGKPRTLHIKESLETIDYCRGPVAPMKPGASIHPQAQQLVACDKFVLRRWNLSVDDSFETHDRFHIFTSIEGSATISVDDSSARLDRGDTILVPACCKSVTLTPHGNVTLLDMFLP